METEEKENQISWWRYETYTKCPQQFQWKHVQKLEPPREENKVHTVYGFVMQELWEGLILKQRWKDLDLGEAWLKSQVAEKIDKYTKDVKIVWIPGYLTREGITSEIMGQIKTNLEMWKTYEWLKDGVQSEVNMKAPLGNYFLTGRIDFVIPETKHGVMLVDGKGGKRKNVNRDQLKFYATAYKRQHGILPGRLSYYYWREYESSVVRGWGNEEAQRFEKELERNIRDIEDGESRATPSAPACRYCPFKTQCSEYKAWSRREGTDMEPLRVGEGEDMLIM